MTAQDAFIRKIVEEPFEDSHRLVYADWLDEHAGTVPCRICHGPGFNRGGLGGPIGCTRCRGELVVSDGTRERAEFIRVQVELAKLPPKPRLVGHNINGGEYLARRGGPGYYQFTTDDETIKAGDRIDVLVHSATFRGRPRRVGAKPKVLRAVVVTRVEDRGSDGIRVTVKRDADSKQWPGESLAKRERELLGVGWPEWSGPILSRWHCGNLWPLKLTPTPCSRYARGFVAEVRCDTATLLGGACKTCEGSGHLYDQGQIPLWPKCKTCEGKGYTEGVAKALFLAHPITSVQATGLSPYYNGAGWCWFDPDRTPPYNDVPANANPPRDVYRLLTGYQSGRSRWRGYNSQLAANKALSRAVVDRCRRMAELPELEWPGE